MKFSSSLVFTFSISLCHFAFPFTFNKDVSVSLSQFRQLFVQRNSFYERYLESLNEHGISISQWSKSRNILIRSISFEHKMSSIPGVPSHLQTHTEQKLSYSPKKEIIIHETSTFEGVSFLDAFLVERTWTVKPNSSGVKVTVSSKIGFSEDSKLPKFLRKQIEKKSYKDMEKSLNVWATIVDDDLHSIQKNLADTEKGAPHWAIPLGSSSSGTQLSLAEMYFI